MPLKSDDPSRGSRPLCGNVVARVWSKGDRLVAVGDLPASSSGAAWGGGNAPGVPQTAARWGRLPTDLFRSCVRTSR